jgi:hypothetical protein
MRNVLPRFAPPSALTDPFPAQWLRSIQSAGHPVFESLLGGTWHDIYISDGWKLTSDGIIRQGGHSIEFGIKVGKSIKPLRQLPVMVQWCWPKVSLRIRGKSAPDRVIRVIPALCTDSDAATAVAIEISAKESGIAIRTRGLYASTGTLPTADGWSMIPSSSVAERIVFSRTKPTHRASQQLAHASSCVTCLDDSDIPSWLIAAMAPALQYSTNRPSWIKVLLGYPVRDSDPTVEIITKCRSALLSGVPSNIAMCSRLLDAGNPQWIPEVLIALRWLIANQQASKVEFEAIAAQFARSPIGNTAFTHALAYAVSRSALPPTAKSSGFAREIQAGSLLVSPGLAAATFAANGDIGLGVGAAFLTQPSEERQNNLLTSGEWLALLYAVPSGFALSGCLALDASASSPFGVRSPLLTSTFAATLTSRKEIEANRVRISVSSGVMDVHAVRTWRTDTAGASALALHIGKSGLSTSLPHTVGGTEATTIMFPKSVRIGQKESLVISTVGTS